MFKKSFFIFLIAVLPFFSASAQSDEDFEYTTEFIWGINKNTRGGLIGGLVFKYSTAINSRVYQTFGLELMNVKHPQERRQPTITGNTYIYGKQNYLYAIRGQYGRDIILYYKAPQQGVQINANFAIGPTLGLEAPYYIEYLVGNNQIIKEPYEPMRHPDAGNILGTGDIFQGITQSKIVPGLNAKAALSFEFGTFKNNVTGIEAGFLGEIYSRNINLIPMARNTNIFPTAFLTLYYGNRR
jgi:hypothetical protein